MNDKPIKPTEEVKSLEKVIYIPPVLGSCENCKNEPICKEKEDMQRLAEMVKPYSRADKPYRVKIRCDYFENRKCGAINFYSPGDLSGGYALRGNPKVGVRFPEIDIEPSPEFEEAMRKGIAKKINEEMDKTIRGGKRESWKK